MSVTTGSRSRSRIRSLTFTALTAAAMCVLVPVSIPIGPVPISLGFLVLFITAYILDTKHAVLALTIYLLLGLAGLPVFSGGRAGIAPFIGPTGGYILGYYPLIILSSLCIRSSPRRTVHCLGMAAGTLIGYAFGTAWYCILTGTGLIPALTVCVYPFIPFDLLKIAAAAAVGPVLAKRLELAGLRES